LKRFKPIIIKIQPQISNQLSYPSLNYSTISSAS